MTKFIRGIHNIKNCSSQHIVTIGNFDGFHRGHQVIIEKLKIESKYYNLPNIVIIFEPQPQEFFYKKVYRLTNLRNKIKYLYENNIDKILCVNFNKKFSSFNAYKFIVNILVKKINMKCIVIGDDFRFGYNRKGNYIFLQKIARKFKFNIIQITTYTNNGERISSTKIRNLLLQDKIKEAQILLGHPYVISGIVVSNKKLGRIIGYPTANIILVKIILPINGVYIVKVNNIFSYPIFGVANVNSVSTTLGYKQQLEVHLLDVNINLYGRMIDVYFIKKIRNEKKFNSIKQLKQQISADIIETRNFIKNNT
ncbi:MAG: bifunctional riboflavin kinase/FAD synthetase [Candidatus Lightella neohaematopini]|nr:bifunctional riboflavin kinase/FAD synthetase [Candidatus Lightella neohaematopini]MCV2531180.1 bifunctional riboflavin kinase/FAD synthetase [Candidatus Lightella neohaematopini]